jgi:hypothetical protein
MRQRPVAVPYAMSVEPLCVGAFIGHRSLGATAIECVTRVHDGEIWVVPGSTAPKDPGVQRLRRRTTMNGERVWFCGGDWGLGLESPLPAGTRGGTSEVWHFAQNSKCGIKLLQRNYRRHWLVARAPTTKT